MFNLEHWQEIFETISKNKLRTFLTGLSVSSGIFILVILLGFSSGIQNGVRSQFEQDASNRLEIRTRTTTKGFNGLNPGRVLQMRDTDYDNLSEKYDPYLEYKSSIYNSWGSQVNYGEQQGNYRIEGANAHQQNIENASLVNGRFLNQADLDQSRKIAIIGYQVKLDLFKDKDPIGENIVINNTSIFKIVGVYTDPGGSREEARVFIPRTTAQKLFNANDNISRIAYTVKMSDNFDEAVAMSEALAFSIDNDLRKKFSVAPDDRVAIRIFNTLEEARKIYGLTDTIRTVFWFIGLGTIIAGVVGVGNIMLIIVKERTKEIGIRKALGAMPSAIISMVLQEAIFITAIAGLIGLFLGVGLLELVNPYIQADFIKNPTVDFTTVMTTVGILILAGAIAGYIPARRAANIKPIDALRDD